MKKAAFQTACNHEFSSLSWIIALERSKIGQNAAHAAHALCECEQMRKKPGVFKCIGSVRQILKRRQPNKPVF